MTRLSPGDGVSLIGPLGRPFPCHADGSYPVLVAGGYGMAALYLVARNQTVPGIAFFGGATEQDILCVDEFENMGCGVGACLTCVQKVRAANEPGWTWARVCKEGPVFDAGDVLWDGVD